ncbi:carboxyltransferase subunit alpha [Loigolactobacillus jiayinensis]|uniref:acetyl-CoA carboxytransferase n=1 Tax=Loigolactobacillus jiayinensis TaxID=2486016 RepID=A0ABW1R9C3_9LACO|nr:carboxyltransferase subunit alpha [Loigolactobacillus jiayinensis]
MARIKLGKKSAEQVVLAARSVNKVTPFALAQLIFTDFIELHGDRALGDDPAICGGLAKLGEQPVTVITTVKGQQLDEKIATHFGSPEPAGYRKALRLMQQAAKFKRPIINLVDTPGAYPGKAAEEHGQGTAIATTIMTASQLPVPMITLITGEGGSGGALALASADQVWMLENSIYAILSPEGFATILWKDSARASEAAELMQLTPDKLLAQGIIEAIIPETAPQRLVKTVRKKLQREISVLQQLTPDALLQQRQQRFRHF